jgi:nucleotide-binding universal stress UspA family protein
LIENSQTELKPAQKLLANTDIKHSFIIEIGNVAETIINIANKEKVSLIILGSKRKIRSL